MSECRRVDRRGDGRLVIAVLTMAIAATVLTGRGSVAAAHAVPTTDPGVAATVEKIEALADDEPVALVVVRKEGAEGRPTVETEEAPDPSAAVKLARQLAAQDGVRSVEVDAVVRALGTDPLRSHQWGLTRLRAERVHRLSRGEGVTVAVVDSGVDASHPDLRGAVVPGRDYVDAGDGRTDPDGHGTHVAGIIAAVTGNGVGVSSLAPKASIMPMRALDATGAGKASVVANAIVDSVDAGARVINLSLGGPDPSQAMEDAVAYARAQGVAVVAASGNQRLEGDPVIYPAAIPGVVAVGAVDEAEAAAPFSSSGPHVSLAAPGVEIASTYPGGGYVAMDGTSMAAPFVSASVAAMLAVAPELTLEDATALLERTADDVDAAGFDDRTGWGVVDPFEALHVLTGTLEDAFSRDWDGDEVTDLVAADSTGRLYLYPGNGRGGFLARRLVGTGWTALDLLTAGEDWNGDGTADLIARTPRDGRLWLYAGNGGGGFGRGQQIGKGWNGVDTAFSPGDWNGDGATDLVARRTSDGALMLYAGDGYGGFKGSTQIGSRWGAFTALLPSGDWDGDGNPDVMARASNGYLYLYSGDGTGRFRTSSLIGSGWQSIRVLVGIGDWDGDGPTDVLTVLADGTLRLYRGNGRGGFTASANIGRGWAGYRIVG